MTGMESKSPRPLCREILKEAPSPISRWLQLGPMKILLYSALAMLVLVVSVLSGAALTGRTNRAYSVLPPEIAVTVAGETMTVSRMAEIYQPRLYLRASTPSPELLWVWYEAVPGGSTIDLVYYHAWENEISPDPLINTLYSGFRAAYYGYPLYDIEYFQLSVSRKSGRVTGLLFVTSPNDTFSRSVPAHITARYTPSDGGTYRGVLTTREGDRTRDSVDVRFDGKSVLAGVQTWNHLVRLLEHDDDEYNLPQEAQLRFLSKEDFRRYRFARKSQGDHQTEESAFTAPFAALAIFLFLALPVWLLSKRWNR